MFGSWGRYFDWTKYELARGSYGGDTWLVYYRGLDTLDVSNLNLNNMPGPDLWVVQGGARDRRVPNFDSTDPDIKPMYQDSTSVGAEYQLGGTMVLGTHYVHNILSRTIEDIGAIDASGNEAYIIGNPGEGLASDPVPVRRDPARADRAEAEAAVRRRPAHAEPALRQQLLLERQLRVEPAVRQLLGHRRVRGGVRRRRPTSRRRPRSSRSAASRAPGGNANRAWDIDELLWDSHGNLDAEGNLPTDRPHVVKLYGGYTLPCGTQIGGFFYGASGTPLSTYVVTTNGTQPVRRRPR